MSFLFRFLLYSVELAIGLILIGACILGLIWLTNRGLQFFLGKLGYEIGDFFGYIVGKLGFRRKKRS